MPERKRDGDGIYDRNGDGWLWLQHAGKRVSLKTKDRAQARIAAAEHKRRSADPAYAAAHLVTVENACLAFENYAQTGNNRPRPPSQATFEMYRMHFGHFVRIMGADAKLHQIDASTIDDYIATRRGEHIGKAPPKGERDRRRTVQASTVDKELATLRQVSPAARERLAEVSWWSL
jgi:hypothetical protein